jgi:2-dehydro-3-deoxyphosphogluconate aldolase / (4S)-4-hydroxy-2-oxoglutarate aldolase
MEKREILDRMLSEGFIPLIRTASASEAHDVADAIRQGGAGFLEITMTVQGAIEVIKELALKFKDEFIIGAGTVLDPETGRAAILAGARFIVSPTLNHELISLARRYGTVVIPGALTPTEILSASESGADLVKVFPVGPLGGAAYIKAVRAPLPEILLMPSGGITLEDTAALIRAGAAVVGASGALVDKDAVKEKAFHVITENTRSFIKAVREGRAQ